MAATWIRNGRQVAAAAVLSMAMGTVMAVAQDNSSAPPPPPEQQQGTPGPMGPGGPHGRGGPDRRIEMMTKRLNLTPDQVSQVKGIEAEAMTQAKALHEDSSLTPEDRRSKMKGLHDAAQTKVRAVLNDEQKTKYDAMEARRHEHMQHGDGQAPPPPPPA